MVEHCSTNAEATGKKINFFFCDSTAMVTFSVISLRIETPLSLLVPREVSLADQVPKVFARRICSHVSNVGYLSVLFSRARIALALGDTKKVESCIQIY